MFVYSSLEPEQVKTILNKMCLECKVEKENELNVLVPPVRQDILHPCDILEDICIGYGYNNMPLLLPKSFTIGRQFFLNKITDQLRYEISRCGFTEVFTFSLVISILISF